MISSAFAQAAGASPTGGESLFQMLPLLLMFVILYFLMIRPQMKKAKEHRAMVDALKTGDEVIAVGILGKVTAVGDNYVTVQVAPNTEVQVQRGAITTLLPKGTMKEAR